MLKQLALLSKSFATLFVFYLLQHLNSKTDHFSSAMLKKRQQCMLGYLFPGLSVKEKREETESTRREKRASAKRGERTKSATEGDVRLETKESKRYLLSVRPITPTALARFPLSLPYSLPFSSANSAISSRSVNNFAITEPIIEWHLKTILRSM